MLVSTGAATAINAFAFCFNTLLFWRAWSVHNHWRMANNGSIALLNLASFLLMIRNYQKFKRRQLESARQEYELLITQFRVNARPMTARIMESAITKAEANLERIARAGGAVRICEGGYRLDSHGRSFMVDAAHISTAQGFQYLVTCYQPFGTIPPQEKIATALLYLKNDPDMFYRLLLHQGLYFKSSFSYPFNLCLKFIRKLDKS